MKKHIFFLTLALSILTGSHYIHAADQDPTRQERLDYLIMIKRRQIAQAKLLLNATQNPDAQQNFKERLEELENELEQLKAISPRNE
jgi:hypothetical protein